MSQEVHASHKALHKALQDELERRINIRTKSSHLKPKAAAQSQSPYVVYIENFTGESLPVEILFIDTAGNLGDITNTVPANSYAPFILMPPGQCNALAGYYISVSNGPWWPDPNTEGPMTPAKASQVNPNDHDPCADFWGFAPA